MKKIGFFVLMAILIGAHLSCKKDKTNNGNLVEVEYQVLPVSNILNSISYTNEQGTTININNPQTDLPDGIKKIKVSKPFHSVLTTDASNATNRTIEYELVIKVNGEVKASKSASVRANLNNIKTSVDFQIQ